MSAEAAEFTSSLEFDKQLFEADIECNLAHTTMLAQQKIIDPETADKIIRSLKKLRKEGINALNLDHDVEDIHMAVENYVTRQIGEEAGFMHTAKSRNDQVATDLRMVLKDKLEYIQHEILVFMEGILHLASKHDETVMIAYTHLQHAQPTTFAHHLLAYTHSLKRDYERVKDAYKRVDLNPLGSAALTTTSFPIDRELTTHLLGFQDYLRNSMDGVSARDFIAESVFSLALLCTTLSKICEEMVLWSTYEFGIVEIADEFSSTSSIMPQKKNPDVAEIARAKTAILYGELMTILTILRALPYTYNRDLQEITPHLWNSIHNAQDILKLVANMLLTVKVDKERCLKLANSNFATATDLADILVREKKIPFRSAHKIVGRLVSLALDQNLKPEQITTAFLDQIAQELTGEDLDLDEKFIQKALDPLENVKSRQVPGGPSPEQVEEAVKDLKDFIYKERNKN